MNILAEFEKRYAGIPSDTMMIAKGIADDFGLDVEETADYIYIHRYENEEELVVEYNEE